MQRKTKIELFKEAMKFSSAHFTIFSATARENLHGHNFTVYVEFEALVSENGMTFDYASPRKKLIELCGGLNEFLLLPTQSPHLRVVEEGGQVIALFADERLVFLKRDVKLLPVRNVTLEELSAYLLGIICDDVAKAPQHGVSKVIVKVMSGPGQSAAACWEAS